MPRMKARGLDRFLVRLGDHASIRDDRDVGEPSGGHELIDDGQHGLGLGLVALERADHEREAVLPGEQPDGDLRFQAPLLGEPGLAESVARVGLEVERADVVKHEGLLPHALHDWTSFRGRTLMVDVRRSGSGSLAPERVLPGGSWISG
jgi:hypothetical protein